MNIYRGANGLLLPNSRGGAYDYAKQQSAERKKPTFGVGGTTDLGQLVLQNPGLTVLAGHPYIDFIDSNTSLKNVNRDQQFRLLRTHPLLARGLALLLLALIVYGTVFQAVHRHGNLFAPDAAASFSIPEPAGDSGVAPAGCSDCLICQLQQNFSGTLVTLRGPSEPPTFSTNYSDPAEVHFHSLTDSPIAGRAPPLSL